MICSFGQEGWTVGFFRVLGLRLRVHSVYNAPGLNVASLS